MSLGRKIDIDSLKSTLKKYQELASKVEEMNETLGIPAYSIEIDPYTKEFKIVSYFDSYCVRPLIGSKALDVRYTNIKRQVAKKIIERNQISY